MAVTLKRHTIDVDDYHRMIDAGILTEDDQVELIHGEIIHMRRGAAPPFGKLHIALVDRISNLIASMVNKRAIVRIQSSIVIPNHSEPEPDIALLKYQPDFYASRYAQPEDVLLIIEVAHSSWDTDYEVKRPLYATAGILELWLVNVRRHEIEVHQDPASGTYKSISILQSGDTISLPLPQATIALSVDDLLGAPVADAD